MVIKIADSNTFPSVIKITVAGVTKMYKTKK